VTDCKIWEVIDGNKTIEGDNAKLFDKLQNRLRKASKLTHNQRKVIIKGKVKGVYFDQCSKKTVRKAKKI
jgi:anaerobic ribonucleoside-triphosphate reductase